MEESREEVMAEGEDHEIPRKHRIKTWSLVWEMFNCIIGGPGEHDKAECKRCHRILVANPKKHGTMHLWRHDGGSTSRDTLNVGEGPQQNELATNEPSPEEEERIVACLNLAGMILSHGYDASVVEDDYFKSFVNCINPDFELPSRYIINKLCDRIFLKGEWDNLLSIIESPFGPKLSLVVGTTQTVQGLAIYTAYHFIDDEWVLRKVINNACMVVPHPSYHGLVTEADIDFVKEDISNSDLSRQLFSIAWGLTGDYKQEKKTNLEYIFSDTYPVKRNLVCTTYADDVLHSLARYLCDNLNAEKTLSCLFDPISEFNLSRYELDELLALLGLHNILTYNDEQWYSYYCALEIVLNSSKCSSTVQEREFMKLLQNLLGIIYHAIRTISLPNHPTSNICLIELLKVWKTLQSERGASVNKEPIYKESGFLSNGKNIQDLLSKIIDSLDRSIQESYLLWSIPLVLDPRYKLGHIKSIFHELYGPMKAPKYISDITTKMKDIFTDYSQSDQTSCSMGNCEPQELKTELDCYLEDGIVPESDFDVLNWWKDKSTMYPMVARMARDALAMPTCSKLSSEHTSHVWRKIRGYFISRPGTSVPVSNNVIISRRDMMCIFKTSSG